MGILQSCMQGAPSSPCGDSGTGTIRASSGAKLVSIVPSRAWGLGDDTWEVEVPAGATVADLKAKIQELYEVPQPFQRITTSSDASAPALEDGARLGDQRLHLQPVAGFGVDPTALSSVADMFRGVAEENMQMSAALEESLQGVTYQVHFKRPTDAGGRVAGKTVSLKMDALAIVCDVQQAVEVELFGEVGGEPAYLMLGGQPLPPQASLFQAGVEDNSTVVVSSQRPPDPQQQLQEQLLALLGGGALAGGGLAAGVAGGQGPQGPSNNRPPAPAADGSDAGVFAGQDMSRKKQELLKALKDPAVKHLDLTECTCVDDALLTTVAENAKNVRSITLDACKDITDAGVSSIAKRCPELQSLSVAQCSNITDASATALAQKCRKLQSLCLCGCPKVTDAGVTNLAKQCPGLTSIDLTFTRISDAAVEALAQNCRELQTAELAVCNRLTDKSSALLAQRCTKLQKIDVTRCTKLTDAALVAFSQNCGSLQTVNFACAKLTNAGVEVMAKNLQGLQEVDLTGCPEISDDSITILAKQCPGLRVVQLGGLDKVTDMGVCAIAGHCSKLERIAIRGCTITDACARDLLQKCPSLTYVSALTGKWSPLSISTFRSRGIEVELR